MADRTTECRLRNRALCIGVRILIPVLFALLLYHLFTNVVRLGTVVSGSMSPTLEVGDWYVLRVDAYNDGSGPERGDIVVYRLSDGHAYAKRVLAVENDRIAVVGGRVNLNGSWLEEPYVPQDALFDGSATVAVVPEDGVFLLGDNRSGSEDSRDYGPVSVDDVLGKVTRILLPRDRARPVHPVAYD